MGDKGFQSKNANRVQRNFVSATVMLGHLCALYDRGVFEAARLMSNLLYQLAIVRRQNTPLLMQIGLPDLAIVIDDRARAGVDISHGSPLVTLLFGLRGVPPDLQPAASWIPLFLGPLPETPPSFSMLSIDEWLDEKVIPTEQDAFSRRQLIGYVRDQDGGAHSDTDARIAKSRDYLDLIDWFPISKASHIQVIDQSTDVWSLLPPYTHALLRQIAQELLSAIYSFTDIRNVCPLPTVIIFFDGATLNGACVPRGYPALPPIYGKTAAEVDWPPGVA